MCSKRCSFSVSIELHLGQYNLALTSKESGCCGQITNRSYTDFSRIPVDDDVKFSKKSTLDSRSPISSSIGYVIWPVIKSTFGQTNFSSLFLIFLTNNATLSSLIESFFCFTTRSVFRKSESEDFFCGTSVFTFFLKSQLNPCCFLAFKEFSLISSIWLSLLSNFELFLLNTNVCTPSS